jgi:hypothetical protein
LTPEETSETVDNVSAETTPVVLDVIELKVPVGDRPAGTPATVVEDLGEGRVLLEFSDGGDWADRVIEAPVVALRVTWRRAGLDAMP